MATRPVQGPSVPNNNKKGSKKQPSQFQPTYQKEQLPIDELDDTKDEPTAMQLMQQHLQPSQHEVAQLQQPQQQYTQQHIVLPPPQPVHEPFSQPIHSQHMNQMNRHDDNNNNDNVEDDEEYIGGANEIINQQHLFQQEQQQHVPNHLNKLEKLSKSISTTTPYPISIKRSYLQSLYSEPRFISGADFLTLPQSLMKIEDCPFICNSFITRESLLHLCFQNSNYQRYNNFNHPAGAIDSTQYSFSLLNETYTPGKFIKVQQSLQEQPLQYKQYQLLHNQYNMTHFYQPFIQLPTTTRVFQTDSQNYQDFMSKSPSFINFKEELERQHQQQQNHLISSSTATTAPPPSTNYQHHLHESLPQQLHFRKAMITQLCNEIENFQHSKLHKVTTIELPIFLHQCFAISTTNSSKENVNFKQYSKSSQLSSSYMFYKMKHHFKTNLSFSSPEILYSGDLDRKCRLLILSKLFQCSVGRIVLESYAQYENMIAQQQQHPQQQQQHKSSTSRTTFAPSQQPHQQQSIFQPHQNHHLPRYGNESEGKEDNYHTPHYYTKDQLANIQNQQDIFHHQQPHPQQQQHQQQPLFKPTPSTTVVNNKTNFNDDDSSILSSSTMQQSKLLYNHFQHVIIRGDYRLGLLVMNASRSYEGLLNKFDMDLNTPYIPLRSLLSYCKSNLHNITPPPTYICAPIEYFLAMLKLDDVNTHSTTNIIDDISNEHQPQLIHVAPSSEEFQIMLNHHVIPISTMITTTSTTTTLPKRPKSSSSSSSSPKIHVSWKDSISPLTSWLISTAKVQHQCFSQSLRNSHQKETYHNFLSLESKFALQLYKIVTNPECGNIYDLRLNPKQFKKEISTGATKLHHLTIDDVFHISSYSHDGYRSTSRGIFHSSFSRLYKEYGNHILYHFASLLFSSSTSSSPAAANGNGHHHRQQQQQQQQQQKPHFSFQSLYSIPPPTLSTLQHISSLSSGVITSSTNHQFGDAIIQKIIPNVTSSAAFSLSNQIDTENSVQQQHLHNKNQQEQQKNHKQQQQQRRKSWSDSIFETKYTDTSTMDGYLKSNNTFHCTAGLFPSYITDNIKYNNLGRCFSIVLCCYQNYLHSHLIPRYQFNPKDYRIHPFRLLKDILRTKSLLTSPSKSKSSSIMNKNEWNKWWFETRQDENRKRIILAAYIANSTYRYGPKRCTIVYQQSQHQQQQQQQLQPQIHKREVYTQTISHHQSQITDKMLLKAKNALRKVYSTFDIYQGDEIAKHHIAAQFAFNSLSHWTYHGNPLLLKRIQYHQNPVSRFFSRLFE